MMPTAQSSWLRQRSEKSVDRTAIFARRHWRRNPQHVAFEGQRCIRRDHMNLIGHKRRLVLRLYDLHGGVWPQQLNQQAFVVGIEVLHEDKDHTGVGRHVVEEVSECGEAARGRPDAHHQRGGTPTGCAHGGIGLLV
jgi:hypothetical protein